MKKLLITLMLVCSVNAYASVKVDRVWEKYGIVTTLVTYQNNEPFAISKMVFIKCIIFDPSGKKIALGEKLINNPDQVIPIAFTDTYEVMATLNGATYGSVECKDSRN